MTGGRRSEAIVRHGLKLRVSVSLCVLLAAATVLTFFVVTSFWLRESALALAREKEVELVLLADKMHFRHMELSGGDGFFSALVSESVRGSGAVAGCAQAASGKPTCVGDSPQHHGILEQTLGDALQTKGSKRTLSGLTWVVGVPGNKYLDIAVLLAPPGQAAGAVALRYPLQPHYARIQTTQRYVAGYLGVNLLILLVVGFFRFRRTIFHPLENLIRLTDSYSDESGVPFLALQGGDELAQLAGSMQQMLGRIKADREKLQQHVASLQKVNQQLLATREEMVRTEKLSSVGRLAAGLAHEIGNPIGIVQGYLSLIRQPDVSDQEKREFCERAEHELQRISQLVRQLLDLSRPASGIKEEVDVHQVLHEVLALLQPQPLLDGIEVLTIFTAEDVVVYGNGGQLLQVFLNCLINAADAIRAKGGDGRGRIEISTESFDALAEPSMRITIFDNGTGLVQETAANAFDPFFTTKEPGQGTGLGLSVSYALIKAIGGNISLANREGGGAVVSIVLPVMKS